MLFRSELIFLGLKLGAIIALSAVGLSLIFGVTGLVNFAHGELMTLGAVVTWFFNASLGWHLVLAAIPGVLIIALFGGAQERWLWRPLRTRRTGNIAMIVVAIGLSLLLRYGFILVPYGGQPQPFQQYAVQSTVEIFGLSVVPKNLVIIGAALVILTGIGLMLLRTQLGTDRKSTRLNSSHVRTSRMPSSA